MYGWNIFVPLNVRIGGLDQSLDASDVAQGSNLLARVAVLSCDCHFLGGLSLNAAT